VRLAPEGRPFVAGGLAALVVLALAAWLLGGGWGYLAPALWLPVAAWIPLFFRDPARSGPRGDRLVIAPADGRVVSVVPLDEPDLIGGPAQRISIFMSVFSVHVNRYPVSGTVVARAYRPGKFVNASLDKASVGNEQMALGIRGPRGPVLVRQIAGLVARRIVTDGRPGDPAIQGERLGLIRFGSRVDTIVPADVVPRVGVGQRTRAGETIIAEWP
jgi:phosphatidylserine decarboxylase